MKQVKVYFNAEKETEWLNEMGKQGWNLTNYFLCTYTFEKCEPGEYEYQIDTSDKLFKCSEKYRYFMEEMGVDIVCCWGPWVILRRKKSDEPFELYTDDESKLNHYIRVTRIFKTVAIIELLCMLINVYPAMELKETVNMVACILGAVFAGLFINMTFVYNNKIQKIKNGNEELAKTVKSNPMGLVFLGWLLMFASFGIKNSDSVFMKLIAIGLAFLACILFGASIGKTMKKK